MYDERVRANIRQRTNNLGEIDFGGEWMVF